MKSNLTNHHWTCRFALAGLSLLGLPVLAQDLDNNTTVPAAPVEQPSVQQPSARLPITASTGLSEQFNTKLDNAGGKNYSFSITRFNAGVKAPFRLNDRYQLVTSLRYGLDAYNFNGVTSPPWRNINTLQGAAILQWRIDDTWSAFGGAFVKMSSDSDVALGMGATGGGLVGANYKVNDTLDLGLGLGVASQLQQHALLLPLVTARWQFADDWRLNVGLTDVATMGYGAEVQWHFNDAWDFGFGLQYHKSRFRIARPAGSPYVGDGVGQEKAATLYADATWHATSQVDVAAFAGVAAGGNLSAYNNHRDKAWGYNYDPAAILGVKGSVRF